MQNYFPMINDAGADPGFPIGRGPWTHFGGRGPPTSVLFGKNVCENERTGSHRGVYAGKFCM